MKHTEAGNLHSQRLLYRKTFIVNFALLLIIFYLNLYLMSRRGTETIVKPNKFCNKYKPPVIYGNLLYIPSKNTLFCSVPKAASTNLRRVLHAHLFPESNISRSQRISDRNQVWRRLESDLKKFYLHNDVESQSIINNQTLNIFKFLLVRHPLRRIYAAFNDKFVHDHVEDALFGWKNTEEEILLEMYPNDTILSLRRRDARLDFRTFLRFLVDSIRRQRPMDGHWDQIVTRCSICHIDYDWVGKIENLEEDGPALLQKLIGGSGQDLQFPSWQIDEPERNRTNLNDEQIVQLFCETLNNQNDFHTLIDHYEPDFQAFKYQLPSY